MKNMFNNMKIGTKLLTAFGFIVVLYVITVISASVGIKNMSGELQRFYDDAFVSSKTVLQMNAAIHNIGRGMLLTATDSTDVQFKNRMDDIKSSVTVLEDGMTVLNQSYMKDKAEIQELNDAVEELNPYRTHILELLEEKNYSEAIDKYVDEYEPCASQVRTMLKGLSAITVENAEDSQKQGENLYHTTLGIILSVAVLVLIFTTCIWVFITRSITEPIKAIQKTATEIAEGNLNTVLDYKARNELGELSDNLRQTVASLKEYVLEVEKGLTALGKGNLSYKIKIRFKGDFVTLGNAMDEITYLLRNAMQQISNSAEQVSGGAEQVSNGSQLLAQGASEQAGSIEQLATNINDISERVKYNADKAIQSSELAERVGKTIENSNMQMKVLLAAINQSQSNSREITGIVKEIEDIAFQTNILALNASVEAARAGDAGKGFSVVANEVRRLASKATEASKLTADLVQKNTDTVEEGIRAVDSTADYLQKSVEGARTVVAMVNDISKTSVTQANAIAQIRSSIEQITDIVQGNSATSEESAAASEELSAQARILKSLVEQFEL